MGNTQRRLTNIEIAKERLQKEPYSECILELRSIASQ
jgi:hypothetical protein